MADTTRCHICGNLNADPGAWYCSGAHPLVEHVTLPVTWMTKAEMLERYGTLSPPVKITNLTDD